MTIQPGPTHYTGRDEVLDAARHFIESGAAAPKRQKGAATAAPH